MSKDGSVVQDVIEGMFAGAVATLVMGKVTTLLWEREDPAAKERYEQVTAGKYVPERSAEQVEQMLGLDLGKEQKEKLAIGMHWAVGLGAGVTYALVRRAAPRADIAQGLLFGLAFWALFDEGATVVTGLAKPPQEYPWQAHARGLVGHLAYGVVADTALDLLAGAE